jgi:hypothetical protein
MPLPLPASLPLHEAVRLATEKSGEGEDRVRQTLVEAGLAGAIAARGQLHNSALYARSPGRYFAHPILGTRQKVPAADWGGNIDWRASRIGPYDLVRLDRTELESWLATAETQHEAFAQDPTPTGIRTNRQQQAETACEEWIKAQSQRPANKDKAFEAAKRAVKAIGPLSRKAFDRAWARAAPNAWKEPGAREGAPRSRRA